MSFVNVMLELSEVISVYNEQKIKSSAVITGLRGSKIQSVSAKAALSATRIIEGS